ncbi:hypothetical protein BOTBODRAFT_45314 [Botryobasidium botryosum FD-172 SS1]|uniref:Uncharacterized protein n=1 Tax=Botryobasidium botryosum (strain FD-172 SS1) TaxID=930990 RepID=A0A067MCC2_BOTB1|nr:hypothetical protein BOTBODRAFT_45314 [Botryobasidium botryosum FD-172 SS1]
MTASPLQLLCGVLPACFPAEIHVPEWTRLNKNQEAIKSRPLRRFFLPPYFPPSHRSYTSPWSTSPACDHLPQFSTALLHHPKGARALRVGPSSYSACPSFSVHNDFIYGTTDRRLVHDHLQQRLLNAAQALYKLTNADVAVWIHTADRHGSMTEFISQGILNDPKARSVMEPIPAYMASLCNHRRQTFLDKMRLRTEAGTHEQAPAASASQLSEFQSSLGADLGYEGSQLRLGPLPDALLDYMGEELGLTEGQIEDVEAVWYTSAGNHDSFAPGLAELALPQGAARRINSKLVKELVALGYVHPTIQEQIFESDTII